MPKQGSGHIIQVSSIGGISAFPTVGAYHASKWALEGFSQSLTQEGEGFNIHVTLVGPGGFSTDWSGPSATHSGRMDICDEVRKAAAGRPSSNNPGDPRPPEELSCEKSSTRRTGPRASSSAKHPWTSQPRTTNHAWQPGPNGNRSQSKPTATNSLNHPPTNR